MAETGNSSTRAPADPPRRCVARLALVLIAALAIACGSSDKYVDRATLLREAAAALRFPGATELSHVTAERAMTIDGEQTAWDGGIFGTDATDAAVFAFYDPQLRGMGWMPDLISSIGTSVELRTWGWCKPGMSYRLGIEDQARAFDPSFLGGRTFRTVFDARVVSRDKAVACPYVAPSPSR